MAPKFSSVWSFIHTCFYLSKAAERFLFTSQTGVEDKFKSKIYQALEWFEEAYVSRADKKELLNYIRKGIDCLSEIGEDIGKGIKIPEELKLLLQALFLIAAGNVESFEK